MRTRCCSSLGVFVGVVAWLFCACIPLPTLGQQLKTFDTAPLTQNITHRQDFCPIVHKILSGEVGLREALKGTELRVILVDDTEPFVQYDETNGIHTHKPGMIVALMDNLAIRAGFHWRNSFAVLKESEEVRNLFATEVLFWSVQTYDLSAGWWDQSAERMEKGVTFLEPWFDGSIILIEKKEPTRGEDDIDLWNWTRPFEDDVWAMIVVTIFFSALVFQLLEYLTMEQNNRTIWQWFLDNLYLSGLNYTQNYEFAPSSQSGRLLGAGMAFWALIMISTYTANLANIFVASSIEPDYLETMGQAVDQGIPVCTYANTNAEMILQKRYPNAIFLPKQTQMEAYNALNDGECKIYAAYKDNWRVHQSDSKFNPDCNLEWVGRDVEHLKSGFATKADYGDKCTSLVRDVLNLHMTELIQDGELDILWNTYHRTIGNSGDDCHKLEEGSDSRRLSSSKGARMLELKRNRMLDDKESPTDSGGDDTSSSLAMKEMAGTFVMLYFVMVLSVLVALAERYTRQRRQLKLNEKCSDHDTREIISASTATTTAIADLQTSPSSESAMAFETDDNAENAASTATASHRAEAIEKTPSCICTQEQPHLIMVKQNLQSALSAVQQMEQSKKDN